MNSHNDFFEKGLFENRIVEKGNISPDKKTLRFKHNTSLVFPSSEIAKISRLESSWEMSVNVMGLIGPSGALHNHHTAFIIERLHHKDFALRNFLDIFQHRLVSLFYFSWKKNHFYVNKLSKTTHVLLSLIGQGTPGLQNRGNIPDEILLYYAACFTRRHKSVLGLQSILTDYFKLPVSVKPFQKKRMQLPDEEKSQLASLPINKLTVTEKKFNQLGIDAVCGQKQMQYQYHFCLVIGPVDIDKFMAFLPHQKNYLLLIALTRRYSSTEYGFDIQLILNAKSVPFCKLGKSGGARLGWNSWLKVREFLSDANEAILYIRS